MIAKMIRAGTDRATRSGVVKTGGRFPLAPPFGSPHAIPRSATQMSPTTRDTNITQPITIALIQDIGCGSEAPSTSRSRLLGGVYVFLICDQSIAERQPSPGTERQLCTWKNLASRAPRERHCYLLCGSPARIAKPFRFKSASAST